MATPSEDFPAFNFCSKNIFSINHQFTFPSKFTNLRLPQSNLRVWAPMLLRDGCAKQKFFRLKNVCLENTRNLNPRTDNVEENSL